MASMRVTAFTNTFLVSNNGHGGPTLKVVGPLEARKKRPHRKSRLGCVRCKQRKVKCDEGNPCRNCVKRKETCVRLLRASPNREEREEREERESAPLTPPPLEEGWCSLSAPECGAINLLHMELLHHFERHSIPTLPFPGVWPRMLQLAFQSRQHTYLVNAMLSFAAAHLDYLHPGHPQYHRAKYTLLNKALHDYRETLSAPITADNCDALLGTANLIQFLMWCDLSFMEGQEPPPQPHTHTLTTQTPETPLDLSGDRLYFLSTGVRQIFFMAWPLFQTAQSVFNNVGLLQPCVALEDVVDARGLRWQRYLRGFMDLYDNPRYQGGMRSSTTAPSSSYATSVSSDMSHSPGSFPATPVAGSASGLGSGSGPAAASSSAAAYFEGLMQSVSLSAPSSSGPTYNVMTLWQSYKEGEAYVRNAGAHDEKLMRAAYKRLVARLAVAMAFVANSEGGEGACPAIAAAAGRVGGGLRQPTPKQADMVRYVATFPMMCFGPLLTLISGGDSRMLVVLFHIYRVAAVLLPGETYWWCRRRVEVMEDAIGRELRSRGLEVCLRRRSEVA